MEKLLEYIKNGDYEKVSEILSQDAGMVDEFCNVKHELESGWFYRFIINFMTNIDMSEDDATLHYFEIIKHKFALSEIMKRDIGLRVATLDYFLNIKKIFNNPKILEINFFEELLKMSKEDSKTGCFNAKFLHEFTEKEIKRCERIGDSFSIVLLDIDNFKNLNDRHGHLFGDNIIKKFADIISKNSRKEDIISRFGGDEFAIVLPHMERIGARSYAEKLRETIIDHFSRKKASGEKVELTFSAGIATYPHDGHDYESLIKAADSAMYKSKALGKNRVFDALEADYYSQIFKKSERRKKHRHRLNERRELDIIELKSLIELKGHIIDVSENGMLIECCAAVPQKLDEDQKFFYFPCEDNSGEKTDIQCEIVRISNESKKMKFFMGVKFDRPMETFFWDNIQSDDKTEESRRVR